MNVEILRTQCCGSGFCVELAPDVFALDSKQRAIVLDAGAAPLELLLEAAEACPCGAIVVEEEPMEPADEGESAGHPEAHEMPEALEPLGGEE